MNAVTSSNMRAVDSPGTNEQCVSESTPLLGSSGSAHKYTATVSGTQKRRGKGKEEECRCEDCVEGQGDAQDSERGSEYHSSSSASRSRSRHPPERLTTSATVGGSISLEESRPVSKAFSDEERPLLAGASDEPYSDPSRRSWWDENVQISLENKGSVARDHLASERTFLAYMRTSLTIASAGVALVQLFSAASASIPRGGHGSHRLHAYIRPLGAGAVVVGLCVLCIGSIRYFTVQSALVKGSFPVARLATAFIATALTALVTLTFGILLAGKLEAGRP